MGVTYDPGRHLRDVVPDSRQLALCAGFVSGFMPASPGLCPRSLGPL